MPAGFWLRGDLDGYLDKVLLSPRALDRGYFNETYIHQLVAEHRNGRVDRSQQLWSLLMLELWFLVFIDRTLHRSDPLAALVSVPATRAM